MAYSNYLIASYKLLIISVFVKSINLIFQYFTNVIHIEATILKTKLK